MCLYLYPGLPAATVGFKCPDVLLFEGLAYENDCVFHTNRSAFAVDWALMFSKSGLYLSEYHVAAPSWQSLILRAVLCVFFFYFIRA